MALWRTEKKDLWKVGLGAGIAGGLVIALRYALRPAHKELLPEEICPAIFATRVFSTSRGEMVYHESGSGAPLVFVHSICTGASSYEWSKVYGRFAGSHRVLAPDLIGFGESGRPAPALSPADHVVALRDFIRGLCGGDPPVIIGSGAGAGLAVLLAASHPEIVSRLILLLPAGPGEFGRHRLPPGLSFASRLPILGRFLYRNYLSRRAAVRAWLCEYGFADAGAVTTEMVDVFTTCAQLSGAGHAVRAFLSGGLDFSIEGRLGEIRQPVTLLWADRAAFPPREWADKFLARLRAGRLVTLENAGSLAALEAPDQVARVLREELNEVLRLVDPV